MVLLAADTSGLSGSLALARVTGTKVSEIFQVTWLKKAMHSEVATVKLSELLNMAKSELPEITHLAVNIGPGSFTGLRVGLSLIKTLAYSLSIPVVSITCLESLAFTQGAAGEKIFVATKAVQNFFYAASFYKSDLVFQTVTPPRSVDGSELKALSQGCTKVLIEGQNPAFSVNSQAKDLIALLAASGFAKPFLDWKFVEPLYIRGSEAEEKLKTGRLKPS